MASPSSVVPLDRLSPFPAAAVQHSVLLIETEPPASMHAAVLRQTCRVVSTANGEVAKQYLVKGTTSLVIADVEALPEAAGIVRTARTLREPATVLVIASDVQVVPELLVAGCNAVLLKPFPPNLLFARVGRLLRARSALQQRTPSDERPDGNEAAATTNRTWPDVKCPSCDRAGAVSFEFASHRKAWYACLGCRLVWMAKRRE